ncbi:DUF342 domain-containing protein [Aquibacillus rhizosphaerae]|uniref:FapA family protein n=1 Tax=Aquibacillus rhizosphaerae TaxID=3051431 RepID=A0ABT7L2L1_9BACI|nr:FapA family protein [Aquibacillus sp. LR5S19]MDL4840088.1 FapA family protein [Aquibacillus sp. LR5S19]
MNRLNEFFDLTISKDLMLVTLSFKKNKEYNGENLNEDELKKYLSDHNILFGVDEKVVKQLTTSFNIEQLPIDIAKGLPAINGKDGQIHFLDKGKTQVEHNEKSDFRDVFKIPSKKNGEKIAFITAPTTGDKGINVYGKEVKQIPGKKIRIRAGKNVEFVESENAFYAKADGQLSIGEKVIQVFPTYEVRGDLSLKTGNLNFVGSITIHGNVPAGYSVKAEGDVQIFGMVEAAYIEAGGSVIVSEGIAGLRKGTIIAGLDLKAGYINQAIIEVGRDIIINNSILHSHCVAQEHIYCQNGNIIGGMYSAGKTIEAKDIGNKMNTKTELAFGINKKLGEYEKALQLEKKKLVDNKEKLQLLGDSLAAKKESSVGLTSKERIVLLKQRNTMEQTIHKLEEITNELNELQVSIGDLEGLKLVAKGCIYPNVDLTFGKYKRSVTSIYKYSQVLLDNHEIAIQPL